ncbi:MAG: phage scaffolding protein [Enterocloster sp.]
MEELKKASGSSEELQKQITDLQAENKAAKEKYEADMKELKLTTAIKLAIGDSPMTLTLCPDLLIKASCSWGTTGKSLALKNR